jgi:signal transduction histidine kinase
MTWTLRRRLNVSLVAVGVLLVSVVAAAAVLLVQLRSEQDELANDYFQAVNQANDAFVELVDTETAVRGYALTRDGSFLDPLRVALQSRDQGTVKRLETFVAGDGELERSLQAFQGASQLWLDNNVSDLLRQIAENGPNSISTERLQQGKTEFDAVRASAMEFRNLLLDRRAQLRDRVSTETNALFGVVALAALLALIGSAALFVLVRRWVTAPLDRLGADVRRVRDGDLQHLVDGSGPPELASVGAAVDDMRVTLLGRLGEVEAAGHEIERARLRLEEQAEELARSNRDLEQFAYVASHDLQEPLRKVASFCQLLERRYAGQLDERADQYIAFAVDGAKRMQQLINDLLAFSRVGRAGPDQFRTVPLRAALDRAVLNLDAAIEQSGAVIEADPLPEVRGEAGLLAQLFQNLLGNAVKFRGDDAPLVRVTVTDRGDTWELAVLDNGIGVEPQYAERVFVIFQRLHPKSAYEGTGIGLAMCKRIVEHHGGRIWLEPGPDGGTAVRFTLPVAVRGNAGEDADTTPATTPATPVQPTLQEEPA